MIFCRCGKISEEKLEEVNEELKKVIHEVEIVTQDSYM